MLPSGTLNQASTAHASFMSSETYASPSNSDQDPEPTWNPPPWIHTITGKRWEAERAGVHTLRVRQILVRRRRVWAAQAERRVGAWRAEGRGVARRRPAGRRGPAGASAALRWEARRRGAAAVRPPFPSLRRPLKPGATSIVSCSRLETESCQLPLLVPMSALSRPEFHGEKAASVHLERVIWNGQPVCPH